MKRRSFLYHLFPAAIVIFFIFSFYRAPGRLDPCRNDSLSWKVSKNAQFDIYYTDTDEAQLTIVQPYLASGHDFIELFFGDRYIHKFNVYIFPERKKLDEQWQQDWGDISFLSQCWMVASGVGDRLDILSPGIWTNEACEHDAKDSAELRRLIWHELVHVFHGQHNSDHKFERLEELDWLVEGVATYASGQLSPKRITSVRTSIAQGKEPNALNKFWKGNLKYGWAGSLVAHIDHKYGRNKLFDLLKLSSTKDALSFLRISEQQLIDEWKKSLQ